MSQTSERADYTALTDRMTYLLVLRLALAGIVLAWMSLRPETLGLPLRDMVLASTFYIVAAIALEFARRRIARLNYALLTTMLLLDGIFLAWSMYGTGGTQSPIRFLTYLHLVGVSLLASYRTGLKIALWHSLLLFVVLYAQAAQLLPPIDVVGGGAVEFDRMAVLNVTSFWLFALATSLFSAMNERELRQRRSDLEAMVEIGSRLDDVRDPLHQSRIVLDGLAEQFGFPRGLILGATDDKVVVLATRNTAEVTTTAVEPDWVVGRAWERHDLLAVRELDSARDPLLAAAMPGVRNVLVTPMIADGRPVGAIVVEHRVRRILGLERRIASVVSQVASIAALNLRNAVLLQHVQDLAERDSLTGAANRRMFQLSLERVLATGREPVRQDVVTSVLFIDLDDFKVVNDTLGHAAGDALLVAVTERIARLVRGNDLVARLGGDEFAVLTDDSPDLKRSRSMAERLVGELRAPYLIGDHHVTVTASIGIASGRAATDAADVVRNADVAMYMAKASGKAGFAVFDPGMHAAIRDRHELAAALQRAVELDQLRLEYQPIVDLATGGLRGVEALVRWEHPDRGTIPPGQFIEIAEENGSILPIGRWVLRQACEQTGRWQRDGRTPTEMFLSVNVSAREVQQPGFVEGVRDTLREAGLEPERLVLEITETALLRATPSTTATLGALRRLGVRIVIDDFGTGYFSLSHLRQFPVDALKIAREFVQGGDSASRSSALAGAIVALGRSLGIETVAEGIETAGQAERMRDLGCTYGQGHYFGFPLTGAQFEGTLRPASNTPSRAGDAAEAQPARRVRAGQAPRLGLGPEVGTAPV